MDNKNDLVYKAIESHYAETGDFSISGIQSKLEKFHLTMEPAIIQSRINEYKKTRSYKANSPEAQDSAKKSGH